MATTMPAQVPSGYSTTDTYFASRFKQGGRVVYNLDLSLLQITSLIVRPDPERPVESNRAIRAKHAKDFADYFRTQTRWVIPSLILRAPAPFKFEVLHEVAGSKFGVLEIARSAARDVNILDGQHRILGFFIAAADIVADLDKSREALQKAERNDPGGAASRYIRDDIALLEEQYARLDSERAAIQIYIEEDPVAYRQMFFDISDNALGITASVRSRFDSRKVVNRALPMVLESPLLASRIEMELDRINRKSENFLSAKNVAEIIKNVTVGLNGRVSRRQDQELEERHVADRAKAFFDDLTEAFPRCAQCSWDSCSPENCARQACLGLRGSFEFLPGSTTSSFSLTCMAGAANRWSTTSGSSHRMFPATAPRLSRLDLDGPHGGGVIPRWSSRPVGKEAGSSGSS
ncbi:hypothetical protein G7068_16240 [Leucobacter viscericola]|uniref:DGQHR domain-containing protein n=1 Tax=Leucobacter viscericola TaxID=2714935 RepID=A0A6G7XJP4_9MICO|nr:DNA sulfur modification protein DndB [Leucobacter viscericola]QIK64597.1 hypothetical protein G7068_16240 [Leucobacter viscericola]